jgi:hypothetical protein
MLSLPEHLREDRDTDLSSIFLFVRREAENIMAAFTTEEERRRRAAEAAAKRMGL